MRFRRSQLRRSQTVIVGRPVGRYLKSALVLGETDAGGLYDQLWHPLADHHQPMHAPQLSDEIRNLHLRSSAPPRNKSTARLDHGDSKGTLSKLPRPRSGRPAPRNNGRHSRYLGVDAEVTSIPVRWVATGRRRSQRAKPHPSPQPPISAQPRGPSINGRGVLPGPASRAADFLRTESRTSYAKGTQTPCGEFRAENYCRLTNGIE